MNPGGSGAAVGKEESVSLYPLTPSYEDAEHGIYLRHLREALTGPVRGVIHNIALTGGYGVGKSSILQELSEEFKKSALSLPTLGETGGAPGEGGEDNPAVSGSVTNRIQKEIVKQLLYRERPERVPGYRRLTRFKWLRGTASSLVVAGSVVAVLYLTHFTDRLVHLAGHGLLPHGLVYVSLTLFLSGRTHKFVGGCQAASVRSDCRALSCFSCSLMRRSRSVRSAAVYFQLNGSAVWL